MTLCVNPKCQRPENSDQTAFCQTCGSELLLEGKYRVQSELGAGGFGKTYVVEAQGESLPQVLKVLINPMDKAVELFQREAEVLAQLHHPGIPRVEDDGYFVFFPRNADEPLHCLIMEKIEGLNLQEYMEQRGNRPVNQKLVLQWLIEIVKILEMVHSQHFFHRDIKPSNIMLRTDGRLALIDFGTAREVTGTYMAKQAARGVTGIISTGYTPVEQLNGQAVQQSDFYALGRTISYLLTAREPSDIYDPVTDEFHWQDHAPQVNPEFADFLDQMMARIPKHRPPNTASILDSLERINTFIRTQDPVVNPGQSGNSAAPPISSPPFPAPPSAPINPGGPQSSPPPLSQPVSGPYSVPGANSSVPQAPVSAPGSQGNWNSQPVGFMGQSAYSAGTSGAFAAPSGVRYANFVARCVATLMDLSIIGILAFLVSLVFGTILEEEFGQGVGYATGYVLGYVSLLGVPLFTWLYFAWWESSRRQASPGKQLMRLKVVSSVNGEKLPFGKATVRFMCKLLSTVILVGFPMMLFSKNKQALHDVLAETFVIEV